MNSEYNLVQDRAVGVWLMVYDLSYRQTPDAVLAGAAASAAVKQFVKDIKEIN